MVAILLYERLPGIPEGDLSRLRAGLVNQASLFEVAQSLELGDELLLGEGELKSGGFRRPSILADGFEALLGAVYLDAGFDAVRDVVAGSSPAASSACARRRRPRTPRPRSRRTSRAGACRCRATRWSTVGGEAHQQVFRVECRVDELGVVARGRGRQPPRRRAAGRRVGARAAWPGSGRCPS